MRVIVISGPTCSGKTTLERGLETLGYRGVVGYTTRPKRKGEVDGVDYHFVTDREFDKLLDGRLLDVANFGNMRYGKLQADFVRLQQNSKGVVAVLEPSGARLLRRTCEAASIPFVGVWLDCNPSVQAERFIERLQTLSPDVAARRLAEMLSIEQDWREWARDGTLRCELRLTGSLFTVKQLVEIVDRFAANPDLDSHGF